MPAPFSARSAKNGHGFAEAIKLAQIAYLYLRFARYSPHPTLPRMRGREREGEIRKPGPTFRDQALASVSVQQMRMILVKTLDEPAVVDLAQEIHIPKRQRMDLGSVAVLLVLLQRLLINIEDRG